MILSVFEQLSAGAIGGLIAAVIVGFVSALWKARRRP